MSLILIVGVYFHWRNRMNGYVAFYGRQRCEVHADTLFKAKQLAVAKLKVPKSKEHMVSVMLAEKDDQPVAHSTSEL